MRVKARAIASPQWPYTMDEMKPILLAGLEEKGKLVGKVTYFYRGIVDGYVTYEAEAEIASEPDLDAAVM